MVFCGKSAFGGIALGKLYVLKKEEAQVKRVHISDVETEKARFYDAKQRAFEELGVLYEKACREVGQSDAMIFDVHRMMLEDMDYIE